MYNYTDFFVGKIKTYALGDSELNAILPQENIRKINAKEVAEFPSVIIQTIEDAANSHSFSGEAIASVSIQVEIYSQDMVIEANYTDASSACYYIAERVCAYLEEDLRLSRLTKIDPIPTDVENQVFTMYLRYTMKHDLLNNIISK